MRKCQAMSKILFYQKPRYKPKSGTPSIIQSHNSGLKGQGCSLHFQNQDRELIFRKLVFPYPNQDQYAKPQSGTCSTLQSSKSGHKGQGCSLHFQNQDRELKFGIWLYQRPVTISKSGTRCHTPARNLKRNSQD